MEKTINKRGKKYFLHSCKSCRKQFYRRSDYKKTDYCRDCCHVERRKADVNCYVSGCNKRNYAKGLCQFHYDRSRRGTDLDIGYYGRKKIDFKVLDNGCFVCTTLVPVSAGYYMTTDTCGRKIYLHRMIYQECFGEIPEGHVIRHKCDNPSCINPEHLETGTHRENMHDSVERRRNAFGERNGHAKLSETDVEEILILLSKGHTQKEISRKYNVTPGAIQSIKSGKNWRHITCRNKVM